MGRSANPPARGRPRGRRRQRGLSLVYITIVVMALFGLLSLAVDLGRVQLAKTELQRAADAAARYAATGIGNGTWLPRAQEAAAENQVDGVALQLDSTDVRPGNWDAELTPQFSPLRVPTNAIEIVARRSASRGNPVPLMFARAIGMPTFDLEARSIVLLDRGTDVTGLVGLETITINGNVTLDSYDSNYGTYPAGAGDVSLASNGDIYLTGNITIPGGAHPGPGHRVVRTSGVNVGSTAPLSAPMVHTPPSAGSFETSNDNHTIPPPNRPNGDFSVSGNQTVVLNGGNYYVNDFEMSGSSQLRLNGPATFWITGTVSAAGTIFTDAAKPANLKLRVIGDGDVTFSGNATLAVDVYAPQSDVTINGNPDFSGALVGKSLTVIGNARIHFDRALTDSEPISWNTYATVK